MPTIDSDAHVIESERTWSYLADNEKRFAPMVLQQHAGQFAQTNRGNVQKEYWMFDVQVQPKDRNVDVDGASAESREMADVKARLKHMDELSIDAQILYPTIFLSPCSRDAEAEIALCRAYNRWLADIWKLSDNRLRWAAMVPFYTMERVRDELEFAKANGACSIFVRPFECERYITDSYFRPLFKHAEELDLAITFHAANASFENHRFNEGHNFGKFKLSMIATFHALLDLELPARFPKVRWAFIEAAAGWLPYAITDAEKRLRRKGRRLGAEPLKANNIWITVETTDDIPYLISKVGDDNLVIGTDYGHTDTSAQIEALRLLKENGAVPRASIDKILGANPTALYALPANGRA
jgi:predicted TIM-barrel fold metal-dependent hydrolase